MLPQPERAPLSWDERMEPFGCPLAVYDIFLDIPAVAAVFHFDGSGYPEHLAGETIPFGARILRVCDVFAALTTDRPYRKKFDKYTALEMMIDEVKNYDMLIFLTFQKIVHEEF